MLAVHGGEGAGRPDSGGQGSVTYLTFLSVVSALGGLLFGFDTAVISGTLTPLRSRFVLNAVLEGWLVSSALFGCVLGAGVAGWLSDRFGRKPVLLLSGWLFILCSLGCALAWNLEALIWSRLLGGVGVGLASMVSPLYISEVSTARLRGRMVTLFQFAITVGILLALFSNAWLESLARAWAAAPAGGWLRWMVVEDVWRAMFGMELFPAFLFTTLCLVVPETPRYLIRSGRPEEAFRTLLRVNGREAARIEMREIQATVSAESGSLRQLLQPGLRKAVFIALFLAVVSELSGVTVVLYYGPGMLEKAGFSLGEALGGFVTIGLVNVVFTVVAIWLMDLSGRRPLLLWGTAGCLLALVLIGCLFRAQRGEQILVWLMCLFMACFAFSMGPVKWVVMSEIFPTAIRGRAMALATLAVWATDFLCNQAFPPVRDAFGVAGAFFFFAGVLIPQLFFAWKVMPETRGRSLEEIERSWQA